MSGNYLTLLVVQGTITSSQSISLTQQEVVGGPRDRLQVTNITHNHSHHQAHHQYKARELIIIVINSVIVGHCHLIAATHREMLLAEVSL